MTAHIAQSAEHFLGKEEVTGSSPVVGSMRHRRTGRSGLVGSDGGVAQRLEHTVHTRGVTGSNPVTATKAVRAVRLDGVGFKKYVCWQSDPVDGSRSAQHGRHRREVS